MALNALDMRRALFSVTAVALALTLMASCGGPSGTRMSKGRSLGYKVVSWYGPGFHGKRTASGEVYNMNADTCAHKSMPFGTRLKIVNPENGRSVVVTVNDRGPFVRGRDIDLSRAAAKKLRTLEKGTAKVKVYYLDRDMRYATYLKDGRVRGSSPSVSSGRRTGAGIYTIQVASFKERDSALYMKNGLELMHKKVYIREKWIDGSRYYRVRVGKFRSEGSALKYARKLAFEGYGGVQISVYE